MPVHLPSAVARISIAFSLLTTAGCSTLETAADHAHDFAARHPVAVAVGTAVIVGGAVYALDHRRGDDHVSPHIARSPCYPLVVTQCAQ
jgi:hypothetical protein